MIAITDLQNSFKEKYLLYLVHTVEAQFDLLRVSSKGPRFLDAKMVLRIAAGYFYGESIWK
jgi:hypothetical protein